VTSVGDRSQYVFLAGSISGVVEGISIQPLEMLKTRWVAELVKASQQSRWYCWSSIHTASASSSSSAAAASCILNLSSQPPLVNLHPASLLTSTSAPFIV
jgi:hypothetical protein